MKARLMYLRCECGCALREEDDQVWCTNKDCNNHGVFYDVPVINLDINRYGLTAGGRIHKHE